MTQFDEREKSFEAKFKHDEELKFRAQARRDKLFGLHVATLLGLSGGDAEAYARSVIDAGFKEPGDEDLLGKVFADLNERGVAFSEHRLRVELEEMEAKARDQLIQELAE